MPTRINALIKSIYWTALDEFDLAALRSDAGLKVDGLVVWHRAADDVVVTWAGNDVDFDMTQLVEVPVRRT